MEEIKMYRAADGQLFDNEIDCMNHENDLLEMVTYVKKIKEYCFSRADCNGCPLWNTDRRECICLDEIPADWQ